jgi:hypothetical protein
MIPRRLGCRDTLRWCHSEVALILRGRRIRFVFHARKQQILRSSTPTSRQQACRGPQSAQDDTLIEHSFSRLQKPAPLLALDALQGRVIKQSVGQHLEAVR